MLNEKKNKLLTLLVPCYNEEESLPHVLPEILSYCKKRNFKLIVVNDGSVDKSREILESFAKQDNFKIIQHKLNRGYGASLKSGILNVETDYFVTIDADGQHNLSDVDQLMDVMKSQDADLVVGNRAANKGKSLYRESGKFIIRKFAGLLMPLPVNDINSGIKLYRTELAKRYLPIVPLNMAFSDVMTLTFISQQHLVVEHPVKIKQRLRGKSTISTKTAFETILAILHMVTLFNPMRIFLPISFFFILFSSVWGLPIVLRGHGISVGVMLGFFIGLILFFLGLVAEQLSQIRKDKIFEVD